MKRIILFRFHDHLSTCLQRLHILRTLNPDIPIYGLFGGSKKEACNIQKSLSNLLTHCFVPPAISRTLLQSSHACQLCRAGQTKEKYWNWKNGDLLIRTWFQRIGKDVDFDMLHVVEWDLLLTRSIQKLFGHIPPDTVGLTSPQSIHVIGRRWNWTTKDHKRQEFERLMHYVQKHHEYHQYPLCCFGPGSCIPRSFLAEYSRHAIPPLSTDEVRLPLFAHIFGFSIVDTALTPAEYTTLAFSLFNTDKSEVLMSLIRRELNKKHGAAAFHPCTQKIPLPMLKRILQETSGLPTSKHRRFLH